MDFVLDPRLAQDTIDLGRLRLSQLLLMNDKQYPWLILVPRLPELREAHQLAKEEQISLVLETNLVAKTLTKLYKPDKLNIATIGNIVPQLHVHCIARFKTDAAWPKTVWGAGPALAYGEQELENICRDLREELGTYLKISH